MTNTIRQVLQSRKISQNQLSRLANIPSTALSQIINGKAHCWPAWRARISEALECPEEFLFPEVNQNGNS